MPSGDERQTFGEQVIAWISANCGVPEGDLVGQPVKLMDWPHGRQGCG